MSWKKILIALFLFTSATLASIEVMLVGATISTFGVPNSINYGTMTIGNIYDKTLITVYNTSTGFSANITLVNVTGDMQATLKSPIGTIYQLASNTKQEIAFDQTGNWSLRIVPNKVQQIYGIILLEYNETLANVTRW